MVAQQWFIIPLLLCVHLLAYAASSEGTSRQLSLPLSTGPTLHHITGSSAGPSANDASHHTIDIEHGRKSTTASPSPIIDSHSNTDAARYLAAAKKQERLKLAKNVCIREASVIAACSTMVWSAVGYQDHNAYATYGFGGATAASLHLGAAIASKFSKPHDERRDEYLRLSAHAAAHSLNGNV